MEARLRGDGIDAPEDLLLQLPFRYEDRSSFSAIRDLREGAALISGRVISSRLVRTRRRNFNIVEAAIDDGTGAVRVIWFNRPYLARSLKAERRAVLFGAIELEPAGLTMKNPEYEFFDEQEERDPVHLGRVVGIYRRVAGLSSKWQRRLISSALAALPAQVRTASNSEEVRRALHDVHFPPAAEFARVAALARRTLAREEFLVFSNEVEERRARRVREPSRPWHWSAEAIGAILHLLPFELTPGQKNAVEEIAADFRSGHPMARLLQGDVGSGKTAVALIAALLAAESGKQTAIMAPTEILAEQHAEKIGGWLAGSKYRIALLTGRTKAAARRHLRAALRAGEIDLLIGTHALVERPVEFRDLGLAVIDEQHRFGVAHRARLSRKGERPHVLVLTATPIPRSLAWTLFGDLDVSVLSEKPPGRASIRTYVRDGSRRDKVYEYLGERIRAGERGYIVVPAIEESSRDLAAAVRTLREARRRLPSARIEILHGRLPADEREAAMKAFAEGSIDALVATTVIEVGIDVPEATVMIIENADHFGLAQLHQLRGRIGRGSRPSTCILMTSDDCGPEAAVRLSVVEGTNNGFEIAERDLELRGPGDLLGVRQAGLPDFRVADPIADIDLLRAARDEVRERRRRGETIESDFFARRATVIETAGAGRGGPS